eukprot:CAMPEP_0117006000 /NCGR_PEP_ID=MMETSP0472-20121206/6385_1 /TAXON_ID=693140 ORGANISM="Tiarina fusus, Strain LIS" /NCGR_SAMPLE_ID=MMETSP0472 /ASSEMBLY_ACC=CAM_ASM_000603 /LENGTH=438 /DNA_ID=CAMNT_0004707341 /DNA_START=103 /DNA_END=1416 /DNA_ORIENTATION=+
MTEVVEVEDGHGSHAGSSWCVLPQKQTEGKALPAVLDTTFSNLKPNADKLDKTPSKSFSNASDLKRQQGCSSPDSVLDVLAFIPSGDATANDDDDDSDEDSCSVFQDTITRTIRFADEEGKPLTQVHLIKSVRGLLSRCVVLLMSPSERIFEFLHAEYPLDDSTTVEVVLEQLPKICSNPVFRFKNFVTLSKTKTQELLDPESTMRDCHLAESELLLAILDGYTVNEMASFALPLLLNGRIQKAVKHAKRTGRGLKQIRSGELWRQQNSPRSSQLEESFAFKLGSVVQEICQTKPSNGTELDDGETDEKQAPICSESSRSGSSRKEAGAAAADSQYENLEAVPNLDFKDNPTTTSEESKQWEPHSYTRDAGVIEDASSNAANSADESSEFDVPDLDDESTWKLPELVEYIGGEEIKEKVIFFIHTTAVVSAAGFLLSW